MWTEQQYETAARLAEEERDAALERHRQSMEADNEGSPDGACVDCGMQIPAARLAVWPNARRCVECQADHEKQQKMTRA